MIGPDGASVRPNPTFWKMTENLFILAASDENMVTSITTTFGVSWDVFISQMIAFGIVAFALNKFAYKPVLEVLEKRRQRIAEGLENAEKIKKDLAETEQSRKEILEQANEQANKLIEEGRAAADKVRETETQKAIKEAEAIIAKAREVAEADHSKMLAELKAEIGQLVVSTTSKVIGKTLTPEDQQRLVEETNAELAG